MEKIYNYLFKEISSKGLAIFRIFYGINFLFEIIHLFRYNQLYFDEIPYLTPHFPNNEILLLFWMVLLLLFIVGYKTRWVSVLNYILTLVFISSMTSYEYHMIYAYIGMNLVNDQEFEIVKKKIDVSFEWKKDLLEKNIKNPWEVIGKLKWKANQPQFIWNPK